MVTFLASRLLGLSCNLSPGGGLHGAPKKCLLKVRFFKKIQEWFLKSERIQK